MARQLGSISLPNNIEVLASAPLDARAVVNTKADLTNVASFDYYYVGMITSVKDEGKAYILTDNDPTLASNWNELGAGNEMNISLDTELSNVSENPVQNKVIKAAIDAVSTGKYITVDTLPTEGVGKNVYLVPNGDNTYTQYVWDNDWLEIGVSNIDLTGYVSDESLEHTLEDYATKNDLESLATKAELGDLATKSSLDNYATKTELQEAIDGIDIGSGSGESIDLSNYATKDDLSDYAEKADTYTKTEVDDLIDAIPTSEPVDLSNIYTKTEVDDIVDALPFPVDAYTKTETDDLLSAKADTTTTYTKTEVDDLINNIDTGSGSTDLTDYYTKSETEDYVQGELSDMANEFSDYLEERTENKIEQADLPNIIDTLEDIFEGISLPADTSTLVNAGVLSGFNTSNNGQLTYNGRNVELEEEVDINSVITDILGELETPDTVTFTTVEQLPYQLNTPWETTIWDLDGNLTAPFEDAKILELHIPNHPELDIVPFDNNNGKIKIDILNDNETLSITSYDSDYLNENYEILIRCKKQN